jgi:hypothetical protein
MGKMSKSRKVALGIGVGLLAALLALVIRAVWYPVFPYIPLRQEAFDAERWRTADTEHRGNPRHRMLRSLLREHQFVGMTRSEVVEVLGPPDGASPYYEYWQYSGMGYDLYPSYSPLAWDPVRLVLELDKEDRVIRRRVACDD